MAYCGEAACRWGSEVTRPKMHAGRHARLLLLKLTAGVFIGSFLSSWIWIKVTLSRTRFIFNELLPNGWEYETLLEDDHELQAALSSIDKDPVVNRHTFSYVINNKRFCSKNSSLTYPHHGNPFLLVYVHTAPENSARRQLLRQTWAQPKLYRPDFDVRIVYFMGRRRGNPWREQAVQQEAAKFGDIVQSDFHDSYRNMTHKAVAAVRWIASFCNRTRYVLKTDDDAFVNMRALLKHLSDVDGRRSGAGPVDHLGWRSDGHTRRQSPPRGLILCSLWSNGTVNRKKTKWAVSTSEFARERYPPYCSGLAVVMTTDVVVAFSRVASRVAFYWVDDVYLTGLLPERLTDVGFDIKFVDIDRTFTDFRSILKDLSDGPIWYRYLVTIVWPQLVNSSRPLWTKLEAAARRYPIPDVLNVQPGIIAGQELNETTSAPKRRKFVRALWARPECVLSICLTTLTTTSPASTVSDGSGRRASFFRSSSAAASSSGRSYINESRRVERSEE